ncbi:dopamine beta-hydroxylase [Patella vulgata]|uniref:dopamine beta-hydroxylase n=1 Tax=Patella vulgata TaxID=6465 RepID=UPI0021804BAA|nr:dopamine beta-hydroxylase [Patella vulgata]
MLRVFAIVIVNIVYTNAYAGYQERIPNGDHVPHPCKPNFVWKGVGHLNMAGGGERNAFGQDFAKANHEWTVEFCEKDSDGDGISNGVELGDPNCAWTPGTVPRHVTGITHPGVCDPWGSAECNEKNSWVKCDSDEFKCPAIHEEGVQKMDFRFPWTNVPDKETTYMCMGFDLPNGGDYHMIATTPIINETRVMHHIVLLACEEDSEQITSPRECSMGLRGCTKAIGIWTLGLPGECFNKEAGFRIGLNGMKKGVLQFHWTNPERKADLWDASGMTIYYTDKLRKYNAGIWITGQVYLEIPPLMPKVVQHSTCSSHCTKKTFNSSIFLTTGLNHMHYLGISQYVKLTRSDGSELMITNDEHYSYDTPVLNQYDTPIEVKPGDSLETVCTYRSISRKKTAVYGEGTFDEMCFGIFNYYPEEAVTAGSCLTRKNFEYCDLFDGKCDFQAIRNMSNPDTKQLTDKVMDKCSYQGECLHGCRAVVIDVLTNHECFKNGLAKGITYNNLLSRGVDDPSTVPAMRFVAAMQSCDCSTENPINYVAQIGDPEIPSSGYTITMSFTLLTSLLLLESM